MCFWIYYLPESDLWVKSYDHLNCSVASIVQFRVSRYIMRLNRTSELKVMTIWISWELPLFNFEHLYIWCAWIGHPLKSYDHLNFSRASVDEFRTSRYIMRLNRTSELKVMTIWISWELQLFNFEHLYIWCAWIGPPLKSYDHLYFLTVSVFQFRASRYIMHLNRTSEWKVMTIWISRELLLFNFEHLDILCAWILHPSLKLWPFEFLESFRCSISSVSMYYAPESELWVKSYDHFNFSRDFVVQFRAYRYIMRLNRTSEWKNMTIWISRELTLFNFVRLDILCAWIGPPS